MGRRISWSGWRCIALAQCEGKPLRLATVPAVQWCLDCLWNPGWRAWTGCYADRLHAHKPDGYLSLAGGSKNIVSTELRSMRLPGGCNPLRGIPLLFLIEKEKEVDANKH